MGRGPVVAWGVASSVCLGLYSDSDSSFAFGAFRRTGRDRLRYGFVGGVAVVSSSDDDGKRLRFPTFFFDDEGSKCLLFSI